jgi:non-specific serine/threonine protein kinase/serine/threonine-protein kinase
MEKSENWPRIKAIVAEALERAPEQRETFVSEACAADPLVRAEVESLLSAYENSLGLSESELASQLVDAVQMSRSIGPYRLIRKLGEGGMGQVWLAEQTAPVKRRVALKLIKGGMYDATALVRFQNERQSLALMDHPAIAKVFDAGATPDGQPYFVMEYVAGVPITDYCDEKKMKIADRIELFIQVCDGVQHAHQKTIIHRDLKPANILVVEIDGKPLPRIIDFGLAKGTVPEFIGAAQFTVIGSFLGTPGYVSPEQADPAIQDVDTRTDVYSLGTVLYVLLTGSLPFDGDRWRKRPIDEALRQLREEDPPRPSTKAGQQDDSTKIVAEARGTEAKQLVSMLRGDLDWIAMKAIERDRQRRYATPAEFAGDLRRYLRNEPVQARPASLLYRARKYTRRHRVAVAIASLLTVVLVSFVGLQTVQLRRITRERDRADRIAEFMTGIFKLSDPNERVGNEVTVREVLDKASQDIDKGLAKDPLLQAQLMHVMGNAYLNLGQYCRAQSLYERGIQVSGSAEGQQSRDTLKTMHDLAWVLMQQGHLSEAESLERKVLKMQRHEFGADSPDTLGTLSELAFTLCEEGNCKEAVELNTEVLQKQARVLGPETEGTLITMDNLAINLDGAGRPADAVKLEQQALAIHFRVDGRDNLGTVNAMTNLAGFYRDLEQYDESEKEFRDALEIETRIFGPGQPETAETKYDLAALLARKGRIEEALSLLDQAVGHGLPPIVALGIDRNPFFSTLRGDPRFVKFVAQTKNQDSGKLAPCALTRQ